MKKLSLLLAVSIASAVLSPVVASAQENEKVVTGTVFSEAIVTNIRSNSQY